MLEQLRDWNKESSAFSYLWTCDDKPFCRRKDIPNWPRIYQHPWCILPLHWKSPHTCDSCVQRSISQDQRTKHHPQTAKWRALRVNIVNYILVYTEIIVSSFFSQEIRYSQRWSPRIGKWHFEVHKKYFFMFKLSDLDRLIANTCSRTDQAGKVGSQSKLSLLAIS